MDEDMENMANTVEEMEQTARSSDRSGPSLVATFGVMLVAMAVVVAGALFWLTRSGRLPVGGASAKAEVVVKPQPPKTRLMTLEPLLVNLADSGGTAYLRVAVVLRVEDPPADKDAKPRAEDKPEKGKVAVDESEVLLRDAALDVIGRQSGDALALPTGKEHLKEELRAAFKRRAPEIKVADVLFTEFLIQR